ncbi:MAG: alpha/beta hydrolase-fold protein [Akkermansiaceae bacterium]
MLLKSLSLILLTLTAPLLTAHTFEVSYPIPAEKPIYTPRVYIAISQGFRSPRTRMGDWANLPILFAIDDHDRDGKVTIDENSISTTPHQNIEGNYKVQAIVRINPDWFLPGAAQGDLYSQTQQIDFVKDQQQNLTFTADTSIPAPEFRNQGPIQDHYFKSHLLTKFHHRDFLLRYSVILPTDWTPTKKYPVLVYVTGFSAVHHKSTKRIQRMFGDKGKQAIIVIPDANCRWGHSVFANSAVNGPWGDALTHELLPHIDKTYSGAGPAHRYITGVSSGGWTAAWAIVNYPEAYAQAWPVAPDPVDFEMFQQLNLTDNHPDNLFTTTDPTNDEQPQKEIPRCLSIPEIGWTYQDMATYEHALGPGGQLQSFAAVFSPKINPNGTPDQWYDITTGNIDITVTNSWHPFNISQILSNNWQQLAPKLKGKMHFAVHQRDLFHLDHAIRLLEKKCQTLGSDATFTYLEGTGHHLTPQHAEKIMDSILTRWNQK